MSKAIKFNLILDKHPVRDLDDLRAHFNLDDLLAAYHGELLHRWLEVRGLADELSQVQAITSQDELAIAQALCRVFHEALDEAAIRSAVYPFEFRAARQQQLQRLTDQEFQRQAVIAAYHQGYEKLCQDLLAKAEDYPFQKSAVASLWADYSQLFEVDFDEFFAAFIVKSPLTLFTMLTDENYRQSGLFEPERMQMLFNVVPSPKIVKKEQVEKKEKSEAYQKDTNNNWHKVTDSKVYIDKVNESSSNVKLKDNRGKEYPKQQAVGKVLNGLWFYSYSSSDSVNYSTFSITIEEKIVTNDKPLPSCIRTFAGVTDGYWKDLEPQGTRCLILKMEPGNFIRNLGKHGEELNAEAVNGQFPILDGINYKSNNADHDLIYMVI